MSGLLHGLLDRLLIDRPRLSIGGLPATGRLAGGSGPVVAGFSGSFGRRGAGPVEVRVGQEADLVVQSQVLQEAGAGAVEGAVGVGLLPEAGGERGHEHRAQLLDRNHAQQALDMHGRGLHTYPLGDGGGQREQILIAQVVGGQEGVLRSPGIGAAQPPPQHTHGTAAHRGQDRHLRLQHETGDLLHRTRRTADTTTATSSFRHASTLCP